MLHEVDVHTKYGYYPVKEIEAEKEAGAEMTIASASLN